MGLPTFILFQAIMDDKNDTYKDLLVNEGRRRRDQRIPLAALEKLKRSSFNHLYSSGNNQALLKATGDC